MSGVIAIDGPAGSGKSTVARMVAQRLGLDMLDTGAMYRAVTWAVLDRGVDPDDRAGAAAVAESVSVVIDEGVVTVDGTDVSAAIRGAGVSGQVSRVSAHAGVRSVLRALQRQWMEGRDAAVVEGRDIGTVVFPEAELKVFLTASAEVRAGRRSADRPGERIDAIAAEITSRDTLDAGRTDSPLRQADDAWAIDTSELSVDDVVDLIAERYHELDDRRDRRGVS